MVATDSSGKMDDTIVAVNVTNDTTRHLASATALVAAL